MYSYFNPFSVRLRFYDVLSYFHTYICTHVSDARAIIILYSIENVTITPVEILSQQPADSKNDMKKRRLSAKLNLIKRLQTPYPLGLNDHIYQQGNISPVRSNINVFSIKPDVRRKRRSYGVRRNGLSRRKQT